MNFLISFREFWKKKSQIWLYILSFVLSLGVFVALDSVQLSVENYIQAEKQTLVGGDIQVESNAPFDAKLSAELEAIQKEYKSVEVYEFSSMAQSDSNAFLSQIKVVSEQYPLYGTVALQSGKSLETQLVSGQIVVDPVLLDRLSVSVGDDIQLGDASLKIVDVIENEPDRALNLFSFGPRILVSTADKDALNLIGNKSRIEYQVLIKAEPEDTQTLFDRLSLAVQEPAEVESLTTVETSISRFSDRFLLFLQLVIFSLLILSGIVLMTILTSFLQTQRTIIAIRKSLGESNKKILWTYLQTFLFWSFISFIGVWAFAYGLISAGSHIFGPLFADGIVWELSIISVIKSFFLGVGVTIFFALFVLQNALSVKAALLFRAQDSSKNTLYKKGGIWFVAVLVLYAIFLMLELQNIWWSLIFLGSVLALFGLFWSISWGITTLLNRFSSHMKYTPRLMMRSLVRPGANTNLFVAIFTVSLTFLFGFLLLDHSIQQAFVQSYPADAPNVFLLDIKPDQIPDIKNSVSAPIQFYPSIRGGITQVNQESMDVIRAKKEAEQSFGEPIRSTYNLSYYETIPNTETLVASNTKNDLFGTVADGFVPVSLMEEVADSLAVGLNDQLMFNIQGIEIAAQVTSIRKRADAGIRSPFFYFVFPPEVLKKAPQTLFATVQVESESIAETQKVLLQKFPQLTVLDASVIGKQVGTILTQLTDVIRFFTIFNILIGFIVFVSSLMATSENRKYEAALYRLQGMKRQRVWKIVWYEFLFISVFTIGFSLLLALVANTLILKLLFDLSFAGLPWFLYGMMALMVLSIFGFGAIILYKPLSIKPIEFIRRNTI